MNLDWGSVPDWFAAIGTVGALVLGLIILGVDRRSKRRAAADAYITTIFTSMKQNAALVTTYKVTVSSFNAGVVPVHAPTLHTPRFRGGSYQYEFIKNSGAKFLLLPEDRVDTELDYGERVPDLKLLFVRFNDGLGRQWYRNVESGRYVSSRRYERIMDPYIDRLRRSILATGRRVGSWLAGLTARIRSWFASIKARFTGGARGRSGASKR